MIAELVLLHADVAYTVNRQTFTAYPVCPLCPWRSQHGVAPGTPGWQARITRDVRRHRCFSLESPA